MKLHLLQKVGLIGISGILVISLVFYLMGHFSVYVLTLLMPLMVAILIGYSINNSKKRK
jgi:uncharacterized membrane protein YadS